MGKISLQELSATLQERRQLNKKEASQFVNEMFRIIQESLDQDKLVKVKGLGTFRIIDVEDRESVNVNTGDRVLIEGHGKITFTPDALMKELVNKPFSQFETVVLNEGVDFDDAKSDEEPVEEPAIIDSVEEPVVIDSVEEPVVIDSVEESVVETPVAEATVKPSEPESPRAVETFENPSVAPLVDFVTEQDAPDATDIPDTTDAMDTPDLDSDDSDNEPEPRKWLWPSIAIAACVIGFVAGYFVGRESNVQPWTPEQTVVEEPAPAKPAQDSLQAVPKNDTLSAAKGVQPDAMPAPAKQDAPIKAVEDPAKPAEVPAKPAEAPAKKEEAPAATDLAALDKYEQMDARIRTGAYRIVGLDHKEKVRAGDNLSRICKRTLGPNMECYIEAFNGIKGDAALKAGQEIKIPKLELKKKKSQK